jgi:hypothetical protein
MAFSDDLFGFIVAEAIKLICPTGITNCGHFSGSPFALFPWFSMVNLYF